MLLKDYYNEICEKAVKQAKQTGLASKLVSLMREKDGQQAAATVSILSSLVDNWLCFYLVIDQGVFNVNPQFYITANILSEEILHNPTWKPFLDKGMFNRLLSMAYESEELEDEEVYATLTHSRSDTSEIVRFFSEMVHIASLGIEIGKYEVTGGEYFTIVESIDPTDPLSKLIRVDKWSQSVTSPITVITWFQAIAWCNAKSLLEGYQPAYNIVGTDSIDEILLNPKSNGYRLPTKEEWKYCAQAGTNYKYSGSNNVNEVAWYNNNSSHDTHGVGQKKPNSYGIYDMSGNVWEMTESQANGHPEMIVCCGGAFNYADWDCRVQGSLSQFAHLAYYHSGFRICRNMV